jgi:cytoskeletal protein RodZ
MEARASYGRTGFSKGFIAVIAVLIALGLGVMAAAVAKNANGTTTTIQTHSVKALPASVPSQSQPGYRPGKQTLDDGLAPATSTVAPPASRSVRGHGAVA